MIMYNCSQGSDEWFKARAGCITASMFKVARSKINTLTVQQSIYVNAIKQGLPEKEALEKASYKARPKADSIAKALRGEKVGEFSEQAKNYALKVAIERISGQPLDEGYQTWQARRGNELEPLARMEHEAQTGFLVKEVGIVKTDDGVFGASADGFINDDGGSEYKCFLAPDKLRAIYLDEDISDVIDQVQGCMWITGRKWWHVCLYCPALESVGKQLWYKEFKRDDDYIEQLEADLLEFKLLVDEYEKRLRG
ncbi:lambda exonuclease family protein [Entomomonas asaccharolytica]|uniref:YqaJ viral recombinase family protein n=1 Tax=Entomomonas asaccharolytica TaxID=2785331 RepID=A0A974NI43_9GAMM|nr:lambda exonuclease family protein [Entomomonas asaccharolytica]QQP86904.1 YqaJ viral recombinase family protein [Entomomonas asaccharolytica]